MSEATMRDDVAGLDSERRDPPHLADCDGNGDVPCWACGGESGYHDCGEDCCACLDGDAVTEACEACDGRGFIRCPGCAAHYAAADEAAP